MLDIDHFKNINDTHGHLTGDSVLRGLATILQKRLRPNDRLGRYGGEEFCAILPETSLANAAKIAEELRALVEAHSFVAEDKRHQRDDLDRRRLPAGRHGASRICIAARTRCSTRRSARVATRCVIEACSLRMAILAALLLASLAAAAAEQGSGDTRAQAIADYPTGDSCLFCHRNEIGSTWLVNSHAWTMRPVGETPEVEPLPADATHVIGKEHFRALKQNGYGKFALLTLGGTSWQANVFEKQCAGCHTTAVNPQTGEFSSIALDCYSCHGNVPEDHATQKGTALLSRTRPNADKEVISICGSCHLRGGRSKTQRPAVSARLRRGRRSVQGFSGRPEARQQSADRQQRLARLPEDARGHGRRLGQELRGLPSHPRSAGADGRDASASARSATTSTLQVGRSSASCARAIRASMRSRLQPDSSLDRHRLRQIARLIDVAILRQRDVIREQLQRNVQQQRVELRLGLRHLDDAVDARPAAGRPAA